MKKIGFVMQVVTLIIALPLLTVLEINHVNGKVSGKKTGSYTSIPTAKSAGSLNTPANGKMPS